MIIVALILTLVSLCSAASIGERIQERILDEKAITDTAIQKIIEEEIQNDIVVIPVVKIDVIKLDILKIMTCSIDSIPMQIISILSYSPQELALAVQKLTSVEIEILRGRIVSPEALKIIMAKIKKQDINKLAILVYDVSYQARKLRKIFKYAVANTNFKKYLRDGNLAMVQNCLQTLEVDSKVINTLIAGLGKEVPALTIEGFREYKLCRSQTYEGKSDETAYRVSDYDMIVKQNDLAIFNVTKWSNVIRAIGFVQKNKDKLSAVIIGWGTERDNNFDEIDTSKYSAIMKNHEYFFSTIKAIAPALPVGICVAYRDNTMRQWLKACPFKYDFLAVFNINKLGANFEKIQKRFRNHKLMIGGMNAFNDMSKKQEYEGTAYKNYIKQLKELGYYCSIWIK